MKTHQNAVRLLSALSLVLCGGAEASRLNPSDLSCPKAGVSRAPVVTAKALDKAAADKLRQGIVHIDEGRYTAAYTVLREAADSGDVSDPLERASAYRQIALLMCRLDSPDACQRNFSMAFMTGGAFELGEASLRVPGVRVAYEQARRQFTQRCDTVARAPASVSRTVKEPTLTREPLGEPKSVSLVRTSSADLKRRGNQEATLLIRVKPWAKVSVDGTEFLTPPVSLTVS